MKSSIFALVFSIAVISIGVQICYATGSNIDAVGGSGADAVQSMKNKVNKFKSFFSANPKFIDKQTFPDSSTGFVYHIAMIKPLNVSYDVRQTNSLISPFTGYIEVKYEEWDNKKCADGDYGYKTKEIAKLNDTENCFSNILRHGSNSLKPPYTVRFTFAFQDGLWVFKDIEGFYYGGRRSTNDISAALGLPKGSWQSSEENKFWEELIK